MNTGIPLPPAISPQHRLEQIEYLARRMYSVYREERQGVARPTWEELLADSSPEAQERLSAWRAAAREAISPAASS